MRISKSGKLTVSLTCESASPGSWCFQKNLDANPEKSGFCGKSSTPAHVRFFPKPFISLPQCNCASVGTARARGGYNKKSPTENLAAANAREVITRVRLQRVSKSTCDVPAKYCATWP